MIWFGSKRDIQMLLYILHYYGPRVANSNYVQRAHTSQVDGVCIHSEKALIFKLYQMSIIATEASKRF